MKQIIYILTLTFFPNILFGQAILKVKEGDNSKMIFEKGEWFFKENLPDGHYISYCENDTTFVTKEVFIKNGKKNGMESRFYLQSKQKYAEINWEDGKKNGVEIHYNGNGTLGHLLTFKKDTLNGLCIINWSTGVKHYNGYYKNGFRDSIWTYYDHEKSSLDTSNYWLSEEYKYQNGIKILISAWNNNGTQIVTNGKGFLIDSGYYSTTIEFSNGLKNGKQETKNQDGTLFNEKNYKDGLLIKEISYYDSNKVASISEWSYPLPPEIDTNRSYIDTWITDIFYNEIVYQQKSVLNGYWISFFSNKQTKYEGNYKDGMRVGKCYWYYYNGQKRMFIDYTNNKWDHYNSKGKVVSHLRYEYLTLLCKDHWHLNDQFEKDTLILSRLHGEYLKPLIVFNYDGNFGINQFSEYDDSNVEFIYSYILLADNLTIYLTDGDTFKYKIISANGNEIKLQRLK